MNKKELIKKMENLKKPEVSSTHHKQQLKLTLLNSKKSATFGFFLILTPFLFLFGVMFKYYLKIDFSIATFFYEWIAAIDPDSDSSIISWLIRFLLLGGPAIAVMINLFAILHFQFDRTSREIQVTLKLKWLNLAIVAVCSCILMIFFFYLLVENINHP
ncbi:MAG: hypothetical protein ACE5IR_23715 [bacterium]